MFKHEKAYTPMIKENVSDSRKWKKNHLSSASHPAEILQRIRLYPESMTHADTRFLQKTIGNRAVCQLLKEISLVKSKSEQSEALPRMEQTIQRQRDSVHMEVPTTVEKENKTGLPDTLKEGVESLSGFSMDNVRVHYNSDKPAKIGALAYTKDLDIHVAPGQEKYLPHEAWHVVQQAQGRVRPTMQLKGMQINDDAGLEKEASEMGGKANNNNFRGIIFKNSAKVNNTIQKSERDEKMLGISKSNKESVVPNNQRSYMDSVIIQRMEEWEFRDIKFAFDDLKGISLQYWEDTKNRSYTEVFHELQERRAQERSRLFDLAHADKLDFMGSKEEHPVFIAAKKIIEENPKYTTLKLKQCLGADAVEDFLSERLPPNCVRNVKVKEASGKVVNDVEIDAIDINTFTLISMKAKASEQNEKRDREMWSIIVEKVEAGGYILVNGKEQRPDLEYLAHLSSPNWIPISLDSSATGKEVWEDVGTLVNLE